MQRLSPDMASEFLSEAKRRLGRREWKETERLCQKALISADKLSLEDVAKTTFYLGECLFRKAFESESREIFEHEMTLAAETWESATGISERLGSPSSKKRAMARALYARFWLRKDFESRRELVKKCVDLGHEAMLGFSEDDKMSSAETRAELLSYLRSSNELANDFQDLRESFDQAIKLGRETVRDLTSISMDNSLLEGLCTAFWFLAVRAHIIVEPGELPELQKDAKMVAAKIREVSTRIGSDHADLLENHVAGDVAWDIEGDPARGMKLYEQGAILSEKVKDSLTLGRFYWVLMAAAIWQGGTEEYAENRKKIVERGIAYGEKALDKLRIPHDTALISATYAYLADCYIDLARTAVASIEMKRTWLHNAIDTASKALPLESGTWASNKAIHSINRATYYLATFTDDPAAKIQLLNEGLRTLDEELLTVDKLQPHGWDRGLARIGIGKSMIELAEQEVDSESKAGILNEAVEKIREGLEICKQRNDEGHYRVIAGFCEDYGDTLFRLYNITSDPSAAKSAIAAFEESAELRTKAGQYSILGSLAWKSAIAQDKIGDFQDASTSFVKAADNYRHAARRSLGAAETLRDLAGYMDSWNCVEKARQQHDAKRYSKAAVEYEKANNMLQSTGSWNYLATHYAACSFIEKAEELSRLARLDESAKSFRHASGIFHEAESKLVVKLQRCQGSKERLELNEWLRICSLRSRYCSARALLEEARLLDIQEDNERCTVLYKEASEAFRQLMTEESEAKNRAAMQTMMLFCKGWSEMKKAEASSSPQLYDAAVRTFVKAGNSTSDNSLQSLARANSSASRALQTGTRLMLTRDIRLYPKVREYLLTSVSLYKQAGFSKSIHWAWATEIFFNGLSNLILAQNEKDPSSKRHLYDLARCKFDSATRLYAKAGFRRREAEARRLLEEAREEVGIEAPFLALAGSPAAFQGPLPATLLRDQPLGIERFEATNIIGKATVAEKILKLGAATAVELEMTNAGRSPATLVRLEGIPSEGLQIQRENLTLPTGEGFVDLQGKRLDHSKTYSFVIVLKGHKKGVFEFRPRIVTLEEAGNTRISELDPVTIIVEAPRLPENFQTNTLRKLGSRKLEAPLDWFETRNAKEVFQHLSKEFLTDYMAKGLNLDLAGWRTMMSLVMELRIPRSGFYGPEGRDGAVLSELDRRGLVERRIFSEQRGRGGSITKVRVGFDTPAVREFLKQNIVDSF